MTEYQDVLTETIARGVIDLRNVVRHFPRDRIDWQPSPDGWSAKQHLHHMRHTEERYLDRLEGILRKGLAYTPPPVQPSVADPAESVEAVVKGYVSIRRREVTVLKGLSEDAWSSTFVHPTIWGEISVEWWAERIVEHSVDHLHNLWMLRQLAGLKPETFKRLMSATTR